MTNDRWSDCWCESWHDEPDEGYCLSQAHLSAKRLDETYVQEEYRPRTTTDLEHLEHQEEPHDFD